jgi:hypothetical protein
MILNRKNLQSSDERRIVVVCSDKKKEAILHPMVEYKSNFIIQAMESASKSQSILEKMTFWAMPVIPVIQAMILPKLDRKQILEECENDFAYIFLDISECKKIFRFPINHPIDGIAYACSQCEPDFYVPLYMFHQFMYQSKIAAFNTLCANLGVKKCSIVYAEENNKEGSICVSGS